MPDRPPPYRRPVLPWERGRSAEAGAARWASAGIEFGLCVALFFFGGRWLDGKLSSAPLWTVIGALVGVFMGMYVLIRAALRVEDAPPKGPSAPTAQPPPPDEGPGPPAP